MDLTYHLTRDDYQQYCKLTQARVASHAKGPLGWKGSTILFALASMLVTVLVLVWLNGSGVIHSGEAATAAIGYGWGLWTMQLCGWFWRRQYWSNWLPDDSCLLGELHLRIDGDGLECADQTKSTKYSWRAFSGISENADCIVLWFDRAQGVVVPARALAGEESRRKLVDLARQYIRSPAQV